MIDMYSSVALWNKKFLKLISKKMSICVNNIKISLIRKWLIYANFRWIIIKKINFTFSFLIGNLLGQNCLSNLNKI